MCIEDERVNVVQDMFSFFGYCDLWIHFFKVNAGVWNERAEISFWVHNPSSKWENTPWSFGSEKLHHVCSQRQCDALRAGIAFYKRSTAETSGFQLQLWFPFPGEDERHQQSQPPGNVVVLLEELLSALSPACTGISNEWFPSPRLFGLFRPEKKSDSFFPEGDPLFKGTTLENARWEMRWCLGHLSLHQISLVGEHGEGEAWKQWVAIKCTDFSEILGFLEITSTLWSHWK